MNGDVSSDQLSTEILNYVNYLKQINAERSIDSDLIKRIREDYEKIQTYRRSSANIPNQLKPYLDLLDYQYNESVKKYLDSQQKNDFADVLADPELKVYMSNKRFSDASNDTPAAPSLVSKFVQLGRSISGLDSGSGKDIGDPRIDSKRNILRLGIGSKFLNKFVTGFCLFVVKLKSSEHKRSQPQEFEKELAKVKLYEDNYDKIRAFDLETIEVDLETLDHIAEYDNAMADQTFRSELSVEPSFLVFCEKLRLFLKNLMLHKSQAKQRESLHDKEADVEYYESRKSGGEATKISGRPGLFESLGGRSQKNQSSTIKTEDFNYSLDKEVANTIEIADALEDTESELQKVPKISLKAPIDVRSESQLNGPQNNAITTPETQAGLPFKKVTYESIEVASADQVTGELQAPPAGQMDSNDPENYFSLTNYNTPQNYYHIKQSLAQEAARQPVDAKLLNNSAPTPAMTLDQLAPKLPTITQTDSQLRSNSPGTSKSLSNVGSMQNGRPGEEFLIEQKRLSERIGGDNYSDSGFDMNSGSNSERRPSVDDDTKRHHAKEEPKNLFIQNSNFSEVDKDNVQESQNQIKISANATPLELFDGSFKQPFRESAKNSVAAVAGAENNPAKRVSGFAKIASRETQQVIEEASSVDTDKAGLLAIPENKRSSQGKVLFNSFFDKQAAGSITSDIMKPTQAVSDTASVQSAPNVGKDAVTAAPPAEWSEDKNKAPSLRGFEESNVIFQEKKSLHDGDRAASQETNRSKNGKNDSLMEEVNKDFLISGVVKSAAERGSKDIDIGSGTVQKKGSLTTVQNAKDSEKQKRSSGQRTEVDGDKKDQLLAEIEQAKVSAGVASGTREENQAAAKQTLFQLSPEDRSDDNKTRKTAAFTALTANPVLPDPETQVAVTHQSKALIHENNIGNPPSGFNSSHYIRQLAMPIRESMASTDIAYTNFKEVASFSNLVRQYENVITELPEISKTDLLTEYKLLFNKIENAANQKPPQVNTLTKFVDYNYPPLSYSIVNGFQAENQREWRFFWWKRISTIFSRRFKIVFKCDLPPASKSVCSSQNFRTLLVGLTKIGDPLVDSFVQNYERLPGRITVRSFLYDGLIFMDDFIPIQPLDGLQKGQYEYNLAFVPPDIEGSEVNIFFPVLEKYFAKMFGSYETLHASSFEEMLKVVSSSVEKIDLTLVNKFSEERVIAFCSEVHKDFSEPNKLVFVLNVAKNQPAVFIKEIVKIDQTVEFICQEDGRKTSMSKSDILRRFDRMLIVQIEMWSSSKVNAN